MATVKVKVVYPVWFEFNISDKAMAEIQSKDKETIEFVKDQIRGKADYYLESSGVRPTIFCDNPNLDESEEWEQ